MEGKKFGRLTVLCEAGLVGKKIMQWKCKCDCGNFCTPRGSSLRSGKAVSCGCFQRENQVKVATKHGEAKRNQKTKEYHAWSSMKQRCSRTKWTYFKYYGGRGIKVCSRWESSFETFLSDMGRCPDGMTLERIDVNGDYEPGNCEWASRKAQSNNRRNNRRIDFNGQTKTLTQWAIALGLKPVTLHTRLTRWKNVEKAFTQPLSI